LKTVELKTGVLKIENFTETLDSLIDFGSRMNKKRGFLFVSKVLGKHLPTRPEKMKENFGNLADLIRKEVNLEEPTLFIGFAETATALGHGVFDKLELSNSLYIHTTRYHLSAERLLEFKEEHSHAPSHILYKPDFPLENIKNVVLIDDEISTGKTTLNIVKELKELFPNPKYFSVSMLDWSGITSDEVKFLSLYSGKFDFQQAEYSVPPKLVSERKEPKNLDSILKNNFGRSGVRGKLEIDFSKYVDYKEIQGKSVLVLGTSEFMYVPYLFANYLSDKGIDVRYQATTRSPINVDGVISSKLSFKDNYFEEIDNFLYNIIEMSYELVFVCYETSKLPNNFQLREILEAENFSVKEIFFNKR
jgi:adenine/guanine phosphoribosyltransferase-like PRPP-binding protein